MFKTTTFEKCSTCTVKHFSSLSSIIPPYLKLEKITRKYFNKSMFFLKTVYNVSGDIFTHLQVHWKQ